MCKVGLARCYGVWHGIMGCSMVLQEGHGVPGGGIYKSRYCPVSSVHRAQLSY